MSFFKYIHTLFFLSILLFIMELSGCKKFVEINPPANQLLDAGVFSSDGGATGLVTGMYTRMMSSSGFASGSLFSLTESAGLGADELISFLSYPDILQFYTNSLTPINNIVTNNMWSEPYQYIYTSNVILEGLAGKNGVSQPVKQQLIGEAKFTRAFCYFYLINLFGDVPLYTSSNFQLNAVAARTPSSQVYDQIEEDLKDAQNSLSADYSFSNGERIRPNKWAASALLARVYLYQQKWDSAEAQSTAIISNSGLYNLVSNLDSVFLKNSDEAIWQLLPVVNNQNTAEGNIFILTSAPNFVSLTDFIVNAFEPGDQRRINWIGTYTDGTNTWHFAYKYKVQSSAVITEYSMVLRLAEQYLIRAEARAQQNNVAGAQSDLNIIRSRAGLAGTAANDQSSLLLAVEHERQVELFTEWGHRWLDLVRTNRANSILGVEKTPWSSSDILYPIPSVEIQNNSKITQNAGY